MSISVGIWVVVSGRAIGDVHIVMNSASYVAVWTTVQLVCPRSAEIGHLYKYRLIADQINMHRIYAHRHALKYWRMRLTITKKLTYAFD